MADPQNHPLLLFCDAGNKPQEFQTFVPQLTAGDIVAVHDWGTEFGEGDELPVRAQVERLDWQECAELSLRTRWWRRL